MFVLLDFIPTPVTDMDHAKLSAASILVVEDDLLFRKQLVAYLEKQGADVTGADTAAAARRWAAESAFDWVFLDVNLPDGRGTDLLRDQVFSGNAGVVVMTAEGAVSGAVEAMRWGAVDYLVKPFDPAELPLVIQRARKMRLAARLDEHQRRHQEPSEDAFVFGRALAGLREQLERILAVDRRLQDRLPPVLIEGETGTGKTMLARWLHHRGPRAGQPMVEMNCSAVPETLAESELFGHERGAFTDAKTARIGLLEAAQGGTLFLDELPSLAPPLQAKLLTAIEDGRIRRLGASRTLEVDVRIIAASHKPLADLVALGQMREDLAHRLDLCRIHLPPLRERGQEIVSLAEELMARICRRHRLPNRKITPEGRQRLIAYRWPGNVRELMHELERAIIFEDSHELDFRQLAPSLESTPAPPPAPDGSSAIPDDWFNDHYRFPNDGFSMDRAIQRLIGHALAQSDGNISAAARLLGVSRDYLRYHLAQGKKDGTIDSAG